MRKCHVADEGLKAEPVARVRDRAVAAQVHVPLKKREEMHTVNGEQAIVFLRVITLNSKPSP